MGFVLSKFRKKKPSNKENLERVEKELRDISRFQYDTQLQQKKIIGRLLIYSSVLYLLFAAVFYFLAPRGLQWKEQLLYALPFVLFPALMWGVKQFIGWYYDRKIVSNREKYSELKKEKEKLLDDVMDNETFKVAKEILEKYAPSHLLPKYLAEQQKAISMSPLPTTPQAMSFQEGLRRRQLNMTMGRPSSPQIMQRTPFPQTPTMRPIGPGPNSGQFIRQPMNNFPRAIMPAPSSIGPSGLPISPRLGGTSQTSTPAYMLPLPPVNPIMQNRGMGWMDKLVDYVVGDGASHRYALICRYCATHNGLATPEDFPYTGFRCVFCRQFNPARKMRPAAERLPVNTVLFEEMDQSPSKSVHVEDSPNKENDNDGENEEHSDLGDTAKQEKEDESNFESNSVQSEDPLIESSTKDETLETSREHNLSDTVFEAEEEPTLPVNDSVKNNDEEDLISKNEVDTPKRSDEHPSDFVFIDKTESESGSLVDGAQTEI